MIDWGQLAYSAYGDSVGWVNWQPDAQVGGPAGGDPNRLGCRSKRGAGLP